MQIKWEEYKAEFNFDGSWRDIYVLNTSVSDWQSLLGFLNTGVYELFFATGGEEATFPTSADDLFQVDLGPLLRIKVGSVVLNCHCFSSAEIEFDLDPREIQSAVQAEPIFDFMRQISRALNKEVRLTPENLQSVPIFRFLPSNGEMEYFPCGTWDVSDE